MKRIICMLLIAAMLLTLAACGAASAPAAAETQPTAAETVPETAAPEPTEAAEPAETAAEEDAALYRTGRPWVCADLEGVVTEDMPAEIKDDFALAVNRDFYLHGEIPEGYTTAGTVYDLSKLNADDLARLFLDDNDFSSHDSNLVKTYYDLMMDWEGRNALGVAPLKTETDVIESMPSLEDLIAYYRDYPVEKQLIAPFYAQMDVDLIDPELYIPCVGSESLFLKDSAEYSELTDLGALYQKAYHDLSIGMLKKLGYSDARAREMWDEAFHLEELMAPYIFSQDEMQKPDYISKINNHMTRDEMAALQGRMPVVEYLEANCGMGRQESWLVLEPQFFEAMQSIFTEENLPLIKSWVICHAAVSNSKLLDRECYELYQAANYTVAGVSARPDDVVAAEAATESLPWQTAHMYCDRYFTQQDKDAIQGIIDNVIANYQEMLLSEDFISEETKAYAIQKLATLRVRNLYPDDWSEYTDEELTFTGPSEGGSIWEASEAIIRSEVRRTQEKVKHPVNHDVWSNSLTPTTVNCFYSASDNSINILAAFCRGEVYASDMSYEEICAKMGMVIGHEITHAFDSTGSQFDSTGAFKNWWTDEDRTLFVEKNDRLAAYYSNMTVWDGTNVNGEIKTGEACADMGAMKCMLMLAAEEPSFDYDTFFRSYANLWTIKAKMYFIQLVRKDCHPAGYLRINSVLQQFDEFLDFYGITEGDNMYLAPEDRVAIW